jgi:chromosome segregation ATPase
VRASRDGNELIPLHEPFDMARLGFNRRQVLDHLESLHGRIALLAADRDAALAQVAELSRVLDHLRREADEATAQVQRILKQPMAKAGARIQRILQLVADEAAEAKAHAEAEISTSKTRADQDIAELKARADDQITALQAQASREAKSLLDQARRRCDQLESDSAVRRKAAEQAMAQREAEANERIRNSESRSLASVHLLLRVIDEDLTDRVAAVERDESALRELRAQVASEATALQSLRAEVTAAVTAAHELSTEVLERVRKVPVEPAVGESDAAEQPDIPTQRDGEEGTSAAVAYDHRRLAGTADVVHDGIGPCSPSAHDGSSRRRRHGNVMTAVVKLLRHLGPRHRADQGL